MKMARGGGKLMADSLLDKAGEFLGAFSPRFSLARTSPRTRNCRLPPGESTQSRLLIRSTSSGGESPGRQRHEKVLFSGPDFRLPVIRMQHPPSRENAPVIGNDSHSEAVQPIIHVDP